MVGKIRRSSQISLAVSSAALAGLCTTGRATAATTTVFHGNNNGGMQLAGSWWTTSGGASGTGTGDATAAPDSDDIAQFNSNGSTSASIGASVNWGVVHVTGLRSSTFTYILLGNTLTLTGLVNGGVGDGTSTYGINHQASGTYNFVNGSSGTNGVIKLASNQLWTQTNTSNTASALTFNSTSSSRLMSVNLDGYGLTISSANTTNSGITINTFINVGNNTGGTGGSITKIGAGIATFGLSSGVNLGTGSTDQKTNSYSGGTFVKQGTLVAAVTSALGTGGVTVDTAGLSGSTSATLNLTAANATAVAATVVVNTTGGNAGTINITAAQQFGALGGSGAVSLDSNPLIVGNIANTTNTNFSGTISGLGAVQYQGKSSTSWTLSSGNTYSGGTSISSGTLVLANSTGSATGSGAVVVNGGALGGNGIIATTGNASVSINAGAKLSPGAATNGTLTMNLGTGSVDIGNAVSSPGTASMVFDLAVSGASDEVSLGTNTTLNIGNGVLELDDFALTLTGTTTSQQFVLFQSSSAIIGSLGTGVTGTLNGLNATLGLSSDHTDVVLSVVDPAPEPGSVIGLTTLGFAGLLGRRRRPDRR